MYSPQPSAIRRQPRRRNVHQILARQQARARQDFMTFAPGTMHGDFRFEEVYEVELGAWFEQALFVNRIISISGRTLGYATARIEAGFVTVRHRLFGEGQSEAEVHAWIEAQCEDVRTVVELNTTTYALNGPLVMNHSLHHHTIHAQPSHHTCSSKHHSSSERHYIPMSCDLVHLSRLEYEHLRVTRDHDLGANQWQSYQLHGADESTLINALQCNVMSLMGLCCRLLFETTPCEVSEL